MIVYRLLAGIEDEVDKDLEQWRLNAILPVAHIEQSSVVSRSVMAILVAGFHLAVYGRTFVIQRLHGK